MKAISVLLYYLKIISFTVLLALSVSVQASSLNQETEPPLTPSLSAPSARSTAPALPLYLQVLSGLFDRVEKEELEPTPDLKSLIGSYRTLNKNRLYPPILLHRLTL